MKISQFEYNPTLNQTSFTILEKHTQPILKHLKAKGILAGSLSPVGLWTDIIAAATAQQISEALEDLDLA